MGNLTSSLTVKLIDDASKPAKTVTAALEAASKQAQAVAKAMAGTGASDKLIGQLGKMKLGAKDIESVAKAWQEYARSSKLAANASEWTKADIAGIRRWESQTVSALRAVQRERAKFDRATRKPAGEHDVSGRRMAGAIVAGAVAGETAHFARHSVETYREFDNSRRYAKAVMGISDEDQTPLILQAIRGGGTTKYNDIQWLEAQRNLAARGLSVKQVMALTPVAATLGQAMDKPLEDASSLLEGGMFGFGKDISTYEKALANAKRTADLQVKASKISGMNFEDVQQAYKYGAAPFRMAGLSEEQLLAFAAVGKKSNMGGDEMGVAARALAANLLKPTAGAKTAMLANGIDYSKFQKAGSPMQVGAFANDVAARYGVALSAKAKAALSKVFDDKALVADAAKFMPAVMKVLGGVLGGSDAKSKAKIAGAAGRYRDASMGGVDSDGLLTAMIYAVAKNPAFANQVFGSKQGARIRAAIGDPDVYKDKLEQLRNHADGFAQNVSDQRMAGFDGAVSRFEGAVKNLESALPRAFDNDGKGGPLTNVTAKAGELVQALAEAPPALQRLATTAGLAAAAFAGFKGAEALLGGFGLKSAAAELIHAAHVLMGAGAEKAPADSVANLANGKAKPTGWSRIGKVARNAAIIGTVIEAGHEGLEYLNDKHKDEFGDTDAKPYAHPKRGMGGNAHADSFHPATPAVAGKLGAVKQQADDAKIALEAVSATTVTPTVDASGLTVAQAAAERLLSTLLAIQGAAKGAATAAAGIKVPSLGAVNRGSFQASGDPGR